MSVERQVEVAVENEDREEGQVRPYCNCSNGRRSREGNVHLLSKVECEMKDWRKQRHLLQASVVERKTSEHV